MRREGLAPRSKRCLPSAKAGHQRTAADENLVRWARNTELHRPRIGVELADQRGTVGGQARYRRQQGAGVVMHRPQQHIGAAALLDDAAFAHHRHAVGDVFDHGDVVGDEQQAQAQLTLQFAQQVEDLRLHADVQRRGWLVAVDQLRLHRQRAGDGDALEGLGVRSQKPGRRAQDQAQPGPLQTQARSRVYSLTRRRF